MSPQRYATNNLLRTMYRIWLVASGMDLKDSFSRSSWYLEPSSQPKRGQNTESFYHSDPAKQLVHVLEKLSNIGGLVPVETRG